ncbi:branched-chain amino acid ABC transporter permease [Lacrimispora sp.]|uniref:branched-chain amino acid ABC transporter permease n=1 Tax=Lacrimispora sp. TaxID=2719234 RepID=UPI003461265B
MYFTQQLINGISQGSIYALMAIGYTLIVGVVGLITFAYGEMVMIGAMSAYLFYVYVYPNFFLGLLVAFIMSSIAGALIHKLAYERFLDAPKHIALLCTVGCSILLKNLAQIAFGSQANAMPPAFKSKTFDFLNGNLHITSIHMVVIAIVICLAVGLSLFLSKTRVGLMLRAVSQDKKASSLVAIDVRKVTLIGNMVGTGLGGVAGLLYATYLTNVSTIFGTVVGLKAISACVLGGLVNIPGAAVGALVIGILENFGIAIFTSSYRDVFAFAFVLFALAVRPEGLFVWKIRRAR